MMSQWQLMCRLGSLPYRVFVLTYLCKTDIRFHVKLEFPSFRFVVKLIWLYIEVLLTLVCL